MLVDIVFSHFFKLHAFYDDIMPILFVYAHIIWKTCEGKDVGVELVRVIRSIDNVRHDLTYMITL